MSDARRAWTVVSQIHDERRAGLMQMRWRAGTGTKQNAALQTGLGTGRTCYGLCLLGTRNVNGACGRWLELSGESEAKTQVYVMMCKTGR